MTTLYAADFPAVDTEEFKIKWTKSGPTAVATGNITNSGTPRLSKAQKLALAAEAPLGMVDQFSVKEEEAAAAPAPKAKKTKAPKTPKIAKSAPKASSGKSKLPKFVAEWEAIREQIRAGTNLKDIAAAFGVRYYDVYRVKVHGMDI